MGTLSRRPLLSLHLVKSSGAPTPSSGSLELFSAPCVNSPVLPTRWRWRAGPRPNPLTPALQTPLPLPNPFQRAEPRTGSELGVPEAGSILRVSQLSRGARRHARNAGPAGSRASIATRQCAGGPQEPRGSPGPSARHARQRLRRRSPIIHHESDGRVSFTKFLPPSEAGRCCPGSQLLAKSRLEPGRGNRARRCGSPVTQRPCPEAAPQPTSGRQPHALCPLPFPPRSPCRPDAAGELPSGCCQRKVTVAALTFSRTWWGDWGGG